MKIKKNKLLFFFLLFIGLGVTSIIFKIETENKEPSVKDDLSEVSNNYQDPKKACDCDITEDPIYIDDWRCKYSWSRISESDWCSGSGTIEDPYIIENIIINGQNSGSCITIKNSRVYFIIRNCTLYNSGWSWCNWGSGIELINTRNGKVLNNNCSYNNGNGIMEICGHNNNFSNNVINNNLRHGILSWSSNFNYFWGNTIRKNDINGLYFWFSDLNNITSNYIDYNQNGITLMISNYNSITENYIVGNNVSIYQFMCVGNIIKNNKYEYELPPPPPPPPPPPIIIIYEDDDEDDTEKVITQDQSLLNLAIIGTIVGIMGGITIGYLIHKRRFAKKQITPIIEPLERFEPTLISHPEEFPPTPRLSLIPEDAIVKFKDLKKSTTNNKNLNNDLSESEKHS